MMTQYGAVLWSTLLMMVLFAVSSVNAQFTSGSNGSDGALALTTPGTIVFDPRTLNLDKDSDNVYHFTTITIAQGVIVRLRGPQLNMKPVWWLASGTVQIDGIIDLNGEDGYFVTGPGEDRRPSRPGAGGYPGGVGAVYPSPFANGAGPGGGTTADGAGFAQKGENGGGGGGGKAYGNVFLVPLLGGSGGGGGFGTQPKPGGGAGGGALLIASSSSITVNGEIQAKGGNGGYFLPETIDGNLGGGGSGGAIHLKAASLSGTGSLNTTGGLAGVDSKGVPHEGNGSFGRIRLEAFQNTFTGTLTGVTSVASPSNVILPTKFPSVRVVSVAGVTVPEVPDGGFINTDVTIAAGTAAEVQIKAHNIPLGTVVKLYALSQNGDDQVVDSTQLVGSFADSTAKVSLVFPLGFSRAFPRATWTNQ